ncbi:protein phosphatase 2c, putative [Ichthyophthirius multifiliis]|uniref:protein-serine/threonine phosphatase n=1 Tax=Ichthyophthirius multifiliis TaxID=5932 RepID=G0R2K5_ICHMU|nr:protein phosphatase 2c, putative [Ichthyophthirius multifiliis]EGR28296.1 protein phosphatase 2c, putative [Ichthyophthirius multifiliis]|eukprot:XP_004027641.1 protein phosphatase 2c, putative [Ichthyophthirius multifiliis]
MGITRIKAYILFIYLFFLKKNNKLIKKKGLIRNYNEDRISIVLNIGKPLNKQNIQDWPNVSFYGIYDGHGGCQCADFLKDQLHNFIIKDDNFPHNPKQAIINGFLNADESFLKKADNPQNLDRSGSCIILLMILNDLIFVANLGDSRAVLSTNNGQKIIALSTDHKPNHPDEEKRILQNGGKIYQRQVPIINPGGPILYINGPHRVIPGRLAVSRSMGDIEAKFKKYGGNINVVIAQPDITCIQIQQNYDFILLGCDGVFDKLSNEQCINFMWQKINQQKNNNNCDDIFGEAIENLLQQSLLHKSFDNISILGINFKQQLIIKS